MKKDIVIGYKTTQFDGVTFVGKIVDTYYLRSNPFDPSTWEVLCFWSHKIDGVKIVEAKVIFSGIENYTVGQKILLIGDRLLEREDYFLYDD